MIFDNPNVFWFLLALMPVLIILGILGWKAKKRAGDLFLLNMRRLRNKHIEKYVLYIILTLLLTFAWASPQVAVSTSLTPEKIGKVVLLVDVSGSMSARVDTESASRLERVKRNDVHVYR